MGVGGKDGCSTVGFIFNELSTGSAFRSASVIGSGSSWGVVGLVGVAAHSAGSIGSNKSIPPSSAISNILYHP